MVTICEELRTDKLMSRSKIRDFVLTSLKKGKFCPVPALGIFLPQNPENLFEIISLNELLKSPYQDSEYIMLGLAGSRYEAIMLMLSLWKERR